MYYGSASRKVEGGKFARIKIACAHGRIIQVRITGDFFMYPETTLEQIEQAIVGMEIVGVGVEDVACRVLDAVEDAEMIGITPWDIGVLVVDALEMAGNPTGRA